MSNLPPGITDRMIEDQQEYQLTREDIEILKREWYADPCWDIEDTPDFENHYIELKAFRIGCELDWKQSQDNMTKRKAKELNCSLELAGYILRLEDKIQELYDFMVDYY